MKTRSATSNARRTLLRKGRDVIRSVGKKGKAKNVDVMDLLSDTQRQELAHIHLALERIERGIFGACEDCSERIAEERLAETPWNLKCVECESEAQAEFDLPEEPTAPAMQPSQVHLSC